MVTEAMHTTFEEILRRDGHLVYKTRGVSMEPMLHEKRDLVILQAPSSRLKKYDVALYKRENAYVLHRVIGVEKERYLFRGDNTCTVEQVPFDAVIGVLTGFQRKGKQVAVTDGGYQRYVRLWCALYPMRALYMRCRRLAAQAARRLGILPALRKVQRHE